MSNQIKYTTKTATLKSIIGDINEINSKKISANEVFVNDVNGKLTSVVELIKDAETSIGSNVETNVEGINSSIESINENISNLQILVGDTDVSNQISNAINALDVDTHGDNGVMLTQTNGKVNLNVSEGAVNANSDNFVTGKVVNTAITSAINALDVASSSSNGITWSQTDGKVAIAVTPGSVTSNSTSFVTGKVVNDAIASAINALDVDTHGDKGVKLTQTNGKVNLEVSGGAVNANNDNFVTGGAVHAAITSAINALDVASSSSNGITWSQTDGKVAIAVSKGNVNANNDNFVTGGAVYTAIAALSGEGGGITALDTRVTTAEGEIDALQTATNTTLPNSIADAKKAGTDAQAAVTTLANGAVATNASNITTLQGLVGTTSVDTQITNAINELDATNIGTGAVKVTQENGVITSVTTDTAAITAGSNLVGNVSSETTLVTAKQALAADKIVKAIAESKISSVETDTDYFGSPLATTDGTVVTIHPAKEWEIGDKKPVGSITSVINGTASNGSVIDIANLTNGTDMFANNVNLTTFVGNMSKLTNGTRMFSGCTSLATFCGDLSSLTDGTDMFKGCILDIDSVMYIVDSLPVLAEGETRNITIGVNKELVSADDLAAINEALGGTGWTVVEG